MDTLTFAYRSSPTRVQIIIADSQVQVHSWWYLAQSEAGYATEAFDSDQNKDWKIIGLDLKKYDGRNLCAKSVVVSNILKKVKGQYEEE